MDKKKITKIDNKKFMEWADFQAGKRGWNRSRLAKESGVTPSFVYLIAANKKRPGYRFLDGLAKAFELPYEEVLTAAGRHPPKKEVEEDVERATHSLAAMTRDERKQVTDFIEFVVMRNRRHAIQTAPHEEKRA
ncbi:MAG: helix-turn-helix transcriptional regulator [Chloroflexi bacterium]|nr:helix-turn-helix transcriptional regulator [Chloroflexota bacterium]